MSNEGYNLDAGNFACYELSQRFPELIGRPYKAVQFISRKEDTVEGILDSFDYDLVRCAYDGEFKVLGGFIETLRKKRVVPADKKTWHRICDWRDRTGYNITIARSPKEEPAKNIYYAKLETTQKVNWRVLRSRALQANQFALNELGVNPAAEIPLPPPRAVLPDPW